MNRKKPEREYPHRLDGEAEAHLIALACSQPPEGHARWSLRLLRDRFVEMGYVEQVSHETIRQVLKKKRVDGRFTTADARIKLKRRYPKIQA